jgi:hypothetical protein
VTNQFQISKFKYHPGTTSARSAVKSRPPVRSRTSYETMAPSLLVSTPATLLWPRLVSVQDVLFNCVELGASDPGGVTGVVYALLSGFKKFHHTILDFSIFLEMIAVISCGRHSGVVSIIFYYEFVSYPSYLLPLNPAKTYLSLPSLHQRASTPVLWYSIFLLPVIPYRSLRTLASDTELRHDMNCPSKRQSHIVNWEMRGYPRRGFLTARLYHSHSHSLLSTLAPVYT